MQQHVIVGPLINIIVYKYTYFCFIVALILMKIYSQSWSSECINYLFIHLVQNMLQLCT